jgi:hypothetical protein
MTSLEEAFGAGHGISTSTSSSILHGTRRSPPLGMTAVDLSGSYAYINQPLKEYTPEPFKKEDVTFQAETIMSKYREFDGIVKQCKDRKKELEDAAKHLDKYREDLWQQRNSLYNLYFSTGVASQEEFEKLMDAKKACRTAEEAIEKKVRDKWRDEMKLTNSKLEFAEVNLLSIKEYMSLSVKSLIPDGQAKANMCPICYEKEVNRCCVPCGHTLCSTCSDKAGTSCVTCRALVDKTIPLYFSI